jgi:hypothetical protein
MNWTYDMKRAVWRHEPTGHLIVASVLYETGLMRFAYELEQHAGMDAVRQQVFGILDAMRESHYRQQNRVFYERLQESTDMLQSLRQRLVQLVGEPKP